MIIISFKLLNTARYGFCKTHQITTLYSLKQLLYQSVHTFWKCSATLIPGFYVRSTGVVATLQVHVSYGGTFNT